MSGTIRKATMADIPRLMEIRLAVHENILSNRAKVEADLPWFIENGPVWVWDDNGTLKGLAAGDPRDGTIWALFVDPAFEGQGIGRALFAKTCESMLAHGYKTLSLTTDEGTRAAQFYKAAGWKAEEKSGVEITFRYRPPAP